MSAPAAGRPDPVGHIGASRPNADVPPPAEPPLGIARRLRDALAVLLFLTLAAAIGYISWARANVPGDPHGGGTALTDFRDAIYYPVVSLLDGNNPYDTASYVRTYPVGNIFPLYAPLTLVLHLPLGVLPFTTAEVLYFLLTAALVPLLAYLTLRLCHLAVSVGSTFGLASMILLSRPGYWNLFLGQYAALLAVGTYAALLFSRRRPWLAALGVAIVCVKPTFGLPIGALMLARGDVRTVVAGLLLAAAASAAVLPMLIQSAGGVAPFVTSLRENAMGFDLDPTANAVTSPHRIDAVALATRWIGHPLGPAGELAILFGILGLSAVAIRRLARAGRGDGRRLLSANLICVATLSCVYHLGYDLVLLTLPLTATAIAPRQLPPQACAGLRWSLVAALAVPAFNYLVPDTGLRLFATTPGAWSAITSLNGVAVLVALGLSISLAWRAGRGTAPPAPTSRLASAGQS